MVRMLQAQLPTLVKRLRLITDVRNPKKIKHTLVCLLLYGILVFVLHFTSRRQANAEITRPIFEENLRLLFPELDSMPHADTLFRLLSKIDVGQIEQAHIDLVQRLIYKKKFAAYRINNCYTIAIDGTEKMAGDILWSDSMQERRTKGAKNDAPGDTRYQYYVSVLEANLCFRNGMVIPLMSEFLNYQLGDTAQQKQDCEQRAFHRLAERLKKAFPKLPIMLLLDGLYPNGPIMARCRDYNWQFMIVLKDGSLPSVWEEHRGLSRLQPNNEHTQQWRGREQHFSWANQIRYEYDNNKHLIVHTVVCKEKWRIVDENGNTVLKESKHAWVSSSPLRRENVHDRCNLAARYRWGIEACNLVEKHQGYSYEHCFAKNWNAMRGYHALMRLAHLLNTLARFSTVLSKQHQELGVQAFIRFVRTTLSAFCLDPQIVKQLLIAPLQLRFT